MANPAKVGTDTAMEDLIARLETAQGPDRDLDEDIALAIGLWKAWPSKHRYWNFNGPENRHFTFGGPLPHFDPDTGEKIEMEDKPPHGWASECDLPEWTASLDAAMTLVPEGCYVKLTTREPSSRAGKAATAGCYWDLQPTIYEDAETPAIALCIAALKARATITKDPHNV